VSIVTAAAGAATSGRTVQYLIVCLGMLKFREWRHSLVGQLAGGAVRSNDVPQRRAWQGMPSDERKAPSFTA
jgi:hypothetical protein